MTLPKRAAAVAVAGYAVWLTTTVTGCYAFSLSMSNNDASRAFQSRPDYRTNSSGKNIKASNRGNKVPRPPMGNDDMRYVSNNYLDNLDGRPRRGPPPPGPPPPGPPPGPGSPYPRNAGPPPPRRYGNEPPPRSPHLDRHAIAYLEDLRAKRSNRGSYNSDPNSFSVPNAGNTSAEPRSSSVRPDSGGLAQLASGVRTPMDKYNEGPRYYDRKRSNENESSRHYNRERSYSGGYTSPINTISNANQQELRELQEEVERLRTENALLKRSARDLMNNFNELSNRLFDVDESLKKVANVFPSEEELESMEWLMKRE